MSAVGRLHDLFQTLPLTQDAPHRAWARFLGWQIRSRILSEVIITWVGGTRLSVRRGMTGATGNIYVGLHEFADMMLSSHFLRPGDLFLDAGAHIGSHTVLTSGVSGARSSAFEPHAETAKCLPRNIARNDLASRVSVHHCALGSWRGTVSFTSDQVATYQVKNESTGLAVRMETLDGLLAGENPAMIKMDIEGGEEDALPGADITLAKPTPKLFAIEAVTPCISETFARHGFEECHNDALARALEPGPSRTRTSNVVMARDLQFVRSRLREAKPVSVLGRSV